MAKHITEVPARASISESMQQAWRVYARNFWVFSGMLVFYGIGALAITAFMSYLLPMIGSAFMLIPYFFVMFVLWICLPMMFFSSFEAAADGGPLRFNDFFSWTSRFWRIFGGLLLFVVIMFATLFLFNMIFGLSVFHLLDPSLNARPSYEQFLELGLGYFVVILLISLLLAIVAFAYPFMLLRRNYGIGRTLLLSAQAGWRNAGRIILFCLIAWAFSIVCVFTFGIGFLVAIPLLLGTQYFFMRSLFPDESRLSWDFETPAEPDSRFF